MHNLNLFISRSTCIGISAIFSTNFHTLTNLYKRNDNSFFFSHFITPAMNRTSKENLNIQSKHLVHTFQNTWTPCCGHWCWVSWACMGKSLLWLRPKSVWQLMSQTPPRCLLTCAPLCTRLWCLRLMRRRMNRC